MQFLSQNYIELTLINFGSWRNNSQNYSVTKLFPKPFNFNCQNLQKPIGYNSGRMPAYTTLNKK